MSRGHVDARAIDPRDQTGQIDDPTYRVQFWSGSSAEWSWRLSGAADVLQVISWAEAQRPLLARDHDHPFRADSFIVYAEAPDPLNHGGVILTRLVGEDPRALRR